MSGGGDGGWQAVVAAGDGALGEGGAAGLPLKGKDLGVIEGGSGYGLRRGVEFGRQMGRWRIVGELAEEGVGRSPAGEVHCRIFPMD